MHSGQHTLGEKGGSEAVTLSAAELPAHGHAVSDMKIEASPADATTADPGGNVLAQPAAEAIYGAPEKFVDMKPLPAAGSTGPAGGSQPHPNVQPYLVVNFVIALQGIYPSRT